MFPFGSSSSWCRARSYEAHDELLIAPSDDCKWPHGFEKYDPLTVYYSNDSGAPHVDLMNVDPTSVSDVVAFAEKWGLLGTALRWDFVGQENAKGERLVFSGYIDQGAYEYSMPEREYFAGSFKRPEKDLPLSSESFWEFYGEWVDPGPPATGDPKADSSAALWHSGVAYWHQTFTISAKKFQDDCKKLQQGEGDFGRPEYGWGVEVRAQPHLRWVHGVPRMGFRYDSLLDACYLMVILDIEKDALHKCPECGRFWRQTKSIRRSREFCPPDADDMQFHDFMDGPPSRSCTRRAHNRKTDQRKSWKRFLEKEAPDLLRSYEGTLDHPYDMREQMSQEMLGLARRWAERVRRKSSRSYDMWLEPFLGEEG